MRFRNLLTRSFTIGVCAIFIVTNVAGPAPADIWSGRRGALKARNAEAPQYASLGNLSSLAPALNAASRSTAVLNPIAQRRFESAGLSASVRQMAESIPSGRANIVGIDDVKSGAPPVIILQDIHLNAEAQESLVAVLGALGQSGKIGVVGLEGAFGPVDLSRFERFSNQGVVRAVADSFLKAGLLGAPSYLGMSAPGRYRLVGVDDRALYAANALAVVDAARTKPTALAAVRDLRRKLNAAKARIFNPSLAAFDADRDAWSSGTLGLGDYVRRLAARSPPTDRVLLDFLQAYRDETSLDFKRVESERRAVIESLARRMDARSVSQLVSDSLAYRAGTLDLGDYYASLCAACSRAGVKLDGYGEFSRYVRYVLLSDRINAEHLISAIAALESAVEAKLAASPSELVASKLSAHLALVEKLIGCALTPSEWRRYRDHRDEWKDLGAAVSRVAGASGNLELGLSPFEAFYESAESRSRLMVDALMRDPARGARVLVTGGYHAPEIRALLHERGVPVVVVSPRVSRSDGDPTAYLSLFTREKTPLDRLFSGEKLFLSPLSNTPQDMATSNRLLMEMALDHAETLPIGATENPGSDITSSHPADGLARASVSGIDAYGVRRNAHPWWLRVVGVRVTGGFILKPLSRFLFFGRVLTARDAAISSAEKFARRFAWTESLLKAGALYLVVTIVAPSIIGPVALATPGGFVVLAASTLMLTSIWMGVHWLVDLVRTELTGRSFARDWRAMWKGALALNAAGLVVAISVVALSVVVGQMPSPEAAYGVAHALGHGLINLAVAAPALLSVAGTPDGKDSLRATEIRSGDFVGVDIDHYVHAQYRLADRLLNVQQLAAVLANLGLPPSLRPEEAYPQIYRRLAEGHYGAAVIDLINGDSYVNPRLDVAIGQQNKNPYAQSIYEAVANSLDALGLTIGQFGKGVKQAIDWLRPSGLDRIEVVTRQENGQAYRLVIRQDTAGRNYIQLRAITETDYLQTPGILADRGTAVTITTARQIPRNIVDETDAIRVSQESIVEGIKRRFPFVTDANIFVRRAGEAGVEVNGYEKKTVIFPAGTPSTHGPEGRNVAVDVDDHSLTISDNGKGMDAVPLSRMFVPNRGSKRPEPMVGDDATRELEKVRVVHDPTMPRRMSFSRNGEVVTSIDIPASVVTDAAVPGGLMIELGRLIEVPESRDSIILPLPSRPGDRTNFANGVMHAVNGILSHPTLSARDKVGFINTLVIGLDGLIQGNPNNAQSVASIRSEILRRLQPTLALLREDGFLLLPHDDAYAAIAAPAGKSIIYLHPNLFSWAGAAALAEFGGKIVPELTLGGAKKIPLVVVPFQPERVARAKNFDPDWHLRDEKDRLPVIRTDRFIAIPTELGGRLLELATKAREGLTADETDELMSLVQSVNILTASEVVTNYETGNTTTNAELTVAPVRRSEGEVDSAAINEFLTRPPSVTLKAAVPDDATLHWILRENTVVDLKTGNEILQGVDELEQLPGGFAYVAGENVANGIYRATADGFERTFPGTWAVTRNGAYAVSDELNAVVHTPSGKTINFIEMSGYTDVTPVAFASSADGFNVSIIYRRASGPSVLVEYQLQDREKGEFRKATSITIGGTGFDSSSLSYSDQGQLLIVRPALGSATGAEKYHLVDLFDDELIVADQAVMDPGGQFFLYRKAGKTFLKIATGGATISDDQLPFPIDHVSVSPAGDTIIFGAEANQALRLINGIGETEPWLGADSDNVARHWVRDSQPTSISIQVVPVEMDNGWRVSADASGMPWVLRNNATGAAAVRIPLPGTTSTHKVVVDGKYFVLVALDGSEAIFVEPGVGDPIVVRADQKPAFTAVPPSEVAGRYVIGSKLIEKWVPLPRPPGSAPTPGERELNIVEKEPAPQLMTADGRPEELDDMIDMARLTPHVVEIHRNDMSSYQMSIRGGVLDEELRVGTDSKNYSVEMVGSHGDWVVFRVKGIERLFNTKTGKILSPEKESVNYRVGFLSSGRFAYARFEDHSLIVYDISGDAPVEVYREPARTPYGIPSYKFSDRGDLIEITRGGKRRETVAFSRNSKVIPIQARLDELEVDDPGNFVFTPGAGSVICLVNGEEYTGSDGVETFYRTTEDAEFVYVNLGIHGIERISKLTGEAETLALSAPTPRYWRNWTIFMTTIFDRQKGRDILGGARQSFDGGPPHPVFLVGDLVVTQVEDHRSDIYVIDRDENNDFEGQVDREMLAKNRVTIAEGDVISHFPEGEARRVYHARRPALITASKKALIAELQWSDQVVLIANGRSHDITKQIPAGFIPTDVVGETFVFANPATGELRYSTANDLAKAPSSNPKAIQLWNDQIAPAREGLIDRIRAAYGPIWDLAPAAFKADLAVVLASEFATLYHDDEAEIHNRFRSALENRTPVDLRSPLPSNVLRHRNEILASRLTTFIKSYGDAIGQAEAGDARAIWVSVFRSLFAVSRNRDLDPSDFDGGVVLLMALGFDIRGSADLADAAAIAPWIGRLLNEYQAPLPTLRKLVTFLSAARQGNRRETVRAQVLRMAEAPEPVQRQLLLGFGAVSLEDALLPFVAGRETAYRALGAARAYAVFLTNPVNTVRPGRYAEIPGRDLYVSAEGVALSQIQLLEDLRSKSGASGGDIMSVDYLVGKLNAAARGESPLPPPSEFLEAALRQNAVNQREPGAYAAEIAQNAIDANRDSADGKLDVTFYERSRNGVKEFVEEATDNGTGALQEIALDIPRSTKASGGQRDTGGFFGTGKFTVFSGVDRVEIITRNRERAYQFDYEVRRDPEGNVISIRKTRIRELNDPSLPLGVTVRRIKRSADTVPEIDQMLAQRNWKTFAGLTENPRFHISMAGEDGRLEPLTVEKETLSETPFTARGKTWGALRVIATKDMPFQTVDTLGLRVSEMPDDYLTLVPAALKKLLPELGIVVQIPLHSIRVRNSFDHEIEFLPAIQVYVAAEIYKAVAKLAMTRTSPQFVFEGFPHDWETSNNYVNEVIGTAGAGVVTDLAARINSGNYDGIADALARILPTPGRLDKEKLFVKLVLMLEIPLDPAKPAETTSLLERRRIVQDLMRATEAARQAALGDAGEPANRRVPNLAAKIAQAADMERASLIDLSKHRFKPVNEAQAQALARAENFAGGFARRPGLTNVVILDDLPGEHLPFAGLFQGRTMYLHQAIFGLRGQLMSRPGAQHIATEVVEHELAHFLEALMRGDAFNGRLIVDISGFTHDSVGTFAEAMKYMAALALANHETPQVAAVAGGNMEWLRLTLNAALRFVRLPEMNARVYNLYGSWIAESALLALIGAALYLVAPAGALNFQTIFNSVFILFPFLHLPDLALSTNRQTLPARLLSATFISAVMLGVPFLGASPAMLILLAFLVHVGINAFAQAVSDRFRVPRVPRNDALPIRIVPESREASVRRIAGALARFAASAAVRGELKAGQTRILRRLLVALPDEEVHVSEILGRNGRTGFSALVRRPDFDQSGFANELKDALGSEIEAGSLKSVDVLPLLTELASAGVPVELLSAVVATALHDGRRMTIIVNSADDETRVMSLLGLVRDALTVQPGARISVDIVAPADLAPRFESILRTWSASPGVNRLGGRATVSVARQPEGTIDGGTLRLGLLAPVISLDRSLVMVPKGLIVDTTGVPDAVLRSLLVAAIEDALTARMMTGDTLANIAAVAALVARQA